MSDRSSVYRAAIAKPHSNPRSFPHLDGEQVSELADSFESPRLSFSQFLLVQLDAGAWLASMDPVCVL